MVISKNRNLWALLLALALVIGLTSCGGGTPEEIPSESSSQPEPEPEVVEAAEEFFNPLEVPDRLNYYITLPEELMEKVMEYDAINSDTVGWFHVPNTNVSDVVLYYDDSQEQQRNSYYLRRDIYKNYSFSGVFFGDYRCTFDGTGDGLQRNTVIYGHSMNDNINGDLMVQLKRYDPRYYPEGEKHLAEKFASENPYIYLALKDKEIVPFQVFAVQHSTVFVPYNIPNADDENFMNMIEDSLERSIYDYNIEITPDDQILTLSTCTYLYDPADTNNYRFVLMAKRVNPEEPQMPYARFTVKEKPRGVEVAYVPPEAKVEETPDDLADELEGEYEEEAAA